MTQKELKIIFPLPFQCAQMIQNQDGGGAGLQRQVWDRQVWDRQLCRRVRNGTPFPPIQGSPVWGDRGAPK